MSSAAPAPSQTSIRSPSRAMRGLVWAAAITGIWSVIALLSTTQGYMSAIAHGNPTSWMPAFGTSLIWFGAWAVITPIPVAMARRFGPTGRSAALIIAAHIGGAVVTAIIHSAIYAAVSGFVYGREPGSPRVRD